MAHPIPRLLAISDRRLLAEHGEGAFAAWLASLAAAGVDAVQVREKDLPDRQVLEMLVRARRVTEDVPAGGMTVLVNGRADLALASDCAGVHLPADGVPIAALRRRFGDALLIGCSTHRPEEVAAARRDGADYVTFGPVFATPSKAAYGAPPGLAGLRRAAAHGLPVIALGGVGPDEVAAVAAAGAAGVAGIRAFHDLETVAALVEAARRCWPQSGDS